MSPVPVPPYRCIVADPPWLERGGGKCKRGADRHYPLMGVAEIVASIVRSPVWRPADDAHLWCWVTDNHLEDGLEVVSALGFRYVRTMAWYKAGAIGLGQYLRGAHELCLFAVRGRLPAMARDQPSAFLARRGAHSEKPSKAFEIIEAVSPGPRLELFARRPRPGWDVWGNDPALGLPAE